MSVTTAPWWVVIWGMRLEKCHLSLVIIYPTLFTEHLLCAEYESSKSDNWCVGAGGAQEGVEKTIAALSDLGLHIYI